MLSFLEELASTEGKTMSVYLPQGTLQTRVENLLGSVFAAAAIPPGMAEVIAGSGMGAAVFRGPVKTYLVLPHSQSQKNISPMAMMLSCCIPSSVMIFLLRLYWFVWEHIA
jgi:hypothetical protein